MTDFSFFFFFSSFFVLGLQKDSGFDHLGWPRWQLVGCLALTYLVLFLALFKGVKSSGKVRRCILNAQL
jgi:Sodium:neurotransmitter symporter family